jgi:hypothetical protein
LVFAVLGYTVTSEIVSVTFVVGYAFEESYGFIGACSQEEVVNFAHRLSGEIVTDALSSVTLASRAVRGGGASLSSRNSSTDFVGADRVGGTFGVFVTRLATSLGESFYALVSESANTRIGAIIRIRIAIRSNC